MLIKPIRCLMFLLALFMTSAGFADDGLGQTIQIYTRFTSYVGKPTWLFVIRDVDHNQSIPYVFNIRRGDNFWVATTGSRNYLIDISNMQMVSYQARYNTFKNYRISNFCHLESHGRIIRGQSMYITISGDLSPSNNTYTCNITTFPESNFTVVNPDSNA